MAGSRLERFGTVFTRVRDLMHSGVMKPHQKPIWYDVYKAFPPKKEPLYVKPCRFSIKRQDKVPEIFYREDQVRAKFFNLYGSGPQAFDLSKSNFVSTCQRFVDKYTELKSRGELDDDALFEETAKALLEDGITLRRRGAPIVSAEAADSLLDLKLTDLLAEQQSISADSKETVESHTDPDEGPRAI
ncbi:28S ribosomal protein S23, mitochondrial-like [Takifugu rubripes]|uniref:28S ribosomal protein S23, mitochondrial-like n=1 Tax=Takifugu rubripes TaxID=31033 RepID=UPI000298906E|nr:28S ribosomal protein S23, mitochondrial-like [Takifugu rubripes]|eukprot:XP_003977177.1 PREDICTED: 28S ribosomal protein S23, mitochondrial-like [Takifugu rubripes]